MLRSWKKLMQLFPKGSIGGRERKLVFLCQMTACQGIYFPLATIFFSRSIVVLDASIYRPEKVRKLKFFCRFYRILTNLGDGQLCDFVGICSETNADIPAHYDVARTPEDPSIECQFCEKVGRWCLTKKRGSINQFIFVQVVQHWVDVWTSNTTEEEFKEVLDGLCHKLSNSARVNRCLHIVDDYYVPWFDFLAHEVNPQEACTVVGICGADAPGFMEVLTKFPSISFEKLTNDYIPVGTWVVRVRPPRPLRRRGSR